MRHMRFDCIGALSGLTYTKLSHNVGPCIVRFCFQCSKCGGILLPNEYLIIQHGTCKQVSKGRIALEVNELNIARPPRYSPGINPHRAGKLTQLFMNVFWVGRFGHECKRQDKTRSFHCYVRVAPYGQPSAYASNDSRNRSTRTSN